MICYTVKDMPWPASDRDAVVHVKVNHLNENSMNVTVKSVDGYVAKKDGLVRVPTSHVVWNVKQTAPGKLQIIYEAQADPGGSIPDWITNMFLTKGPLESFKKLRGMLEKA